MSTTTLTFRSLGFSIHMTYMLEEILGINVNHPITIALLEQGMTNADELLDFDLLEPTEIVYAVEQEDGTTSQEQLQTKHIRTMESLITWYLELVHQNIDVQTKDGSDFMAWHFQFESEQCLPPKPITTPGIQTTPTAHRISEAQKFRKQIKPDSKNYKDFTDDKLFHSWNRDFKVTA